MENIDGAQLAREVRAAQAAAALKARDARDELNLNPPSHGSLEWAARIWTRPENADRVMDVDLALSIAQALDERDADRVGLNRPAEEWRRAAKDASPAAI